MPAPEPYWLKLARARVSRRRVLAGGVAVSAALAGAVLTGCEGQASTSATRTPKPRAGGTLRRGTTLAVAYGLDPHLERGTGLAIFPRVFGYLHHIDPEHADALVLDHAASVEQPDATTIVVRLRDGVRFQDAEPVNGRLVVSGDAKASIERYRDHPVVVGKVWHKTVLDTLDASDDRVLRVTTRIPYAYSLQQLGDLSAGAIIPRDLVEAAADLTKGAPGSGPFAVARADASSGVWRIAKSPTYYAQPLPYLDVIEWTVFGDDDVKISAIERKDVDQVDNRDLSEAQAARQFSAHIVTDAQPSLASVALGLRTDAPPFADERVRQAVDLALDRDALIRQIAPGSGRVLGPVNPHLADGFWSLAEADVRNAFEDSPDQDQRRAKAAALLQAAGAGGPSFELQTPATPRMIDVATTLRDQLGRAGFDVRIAELADLEWFANFSRGAFEATAINVAPYETPDVPLRFYHSKGPDGTASPFGLHEATIDALVERSWGEADRDQRRATVLQAQSLMLASRAMLQLFTSTGYSSAWEYVQGRGQDLVGAMAQYNYRTWLDSSLGAPSSRAN